MITDNKIEEGIDRYIKYIRRMNSLSDNDIMVVLGVAYNQNPDSYTSIGIDINGHVGHIRSMAMKSDDQIRKELRDSVYKDKDPVMIEIFEDAAKKKAIMDMQKMIGDIKTDAKKFARKVS